MGYIGKMKVTTRLYAFAALTLSILTAASPLDAPKSSECPCYTATTSTLNPACPSFTTECIVPLCLRIEYTTVPGPNKRCPKTPTITTAIPCQTACPTGCAGTETTTVTARSSCLPTNSTTPPPEPTKPSETRKKLKTRKKLNVKTPKTTKTTKPPKPTKTSTSSTPRPSAGQLGDPCGRFSMEPDPPCGPGLTCLITDPRIPDAGGLCQPEDASPVGQIGDRCGTFSTTPDPPCAPGLVCELDDPRVPDAGGECQRPPPGQIGDRCGTFSFPGDPPCKEGLVCRLEDPMVPDIGGECQPAEPTTTPPAEVGKEGDRCDVYTFPLLPECGPGLFCEHISTEVTDLGGYCRKVEY